MTAADVGRRPELLELRYLFLGEQDDPAAQRRFLVEYADAVAARLREHAKRAKRSSICERQVERLALDLLLARHTWAVRALADLESASAGSAVTIAAPAA